MSNPQPPEPPPPERRWTTATPETRRCAELQPLLERLADDTWLLAQKSPALPADPALVEAAGRLLNAFRRLLRGEPGAPLLPRNFAPGISLLALALALRQVQVAAELFVSRRKPAHYRSVDDDIDATNRLTALVLRDMAGQLAVNRGMPLAADLRPPPRKLIPAPPRRI